jgi:hypothetical protein
MSTDLNTSFFMNAQAEGFGAYDLGDDLLHRAENAKVDDPALVETQQLGFNIPESRIHGMGYLWAHPNLRVMSGGVWAWQGHKRNQLASELFDMREFLPDKPIRDGDLDNWATPSGYQVEVVKPLEELRITYEDSVRGNALDITFSAIMPPAMLASGKHFEQAMRTRGEVVLRNRRHIVNGYTIRDRSWAEARPETPLDLAPVHWLTATFSDDFALHISGLEDPATAPWGDRYQPRDPRSAGMARGWVWRDGELTAMHSFQIQTSWDFATGYQTGHVVDFVDAEGRSHRLTGEILGGCNWFVWSNFGSNINLCRWECDGRIGHGESQIGLWTDFVHATSV